MKISVPHIPLAILNAASVKAPSGSLESVARKLVAFLVPGNVAVLTGAGVSVDSGIRAYRGEDGTYMNPNYRPIFYHELVEDSDKGRHFRKRYWCRSYLGYPPMARALPNPAHYAISALQHMGIVSKLITQNVDGLHILAQPPSWSHIISSERILELHGTLHTVHCRFGHELRRDVFQVMLGHANPRWKFFLDQSELTGTQPRTNPDGDVELQGATYDDFIIPYCESCLKTDRKEPILKPSLTFFGDSLSNEVKQRSYQDIENCDRLLLVGTTLATYSAFRLFKHAVELSKPIMILNVGPTRADPFIQPPHISKLEWRSSEALKEAAAMITYDRFPVDSDLKRLLTSGVITPIDSTKR